LLGKVTRSAGWGVVRRLRPKSDCTTVTPNLHRSTPAFRTPSAATRHLPRFAEKGDLFLDAWQFDATDPERVKKQQGWIELLQGKTTLSELIKATERRVSR